MDLKKMIELQNINIVYPDKTVAIKNLTHKIETGESIALVGGNGAGKTSLILGLCGILSFDGTIVIDELNFSKTNANKKILEQVRKKIGVVFQNPDDQLFMSTIYDDIAFGLRNMKIAENEIKNRITDVLEKLNIMHLMDKTTLKLSGGEKRLCAIATVLVMQPDIIILDEPTAFLDPKAKKILVKVLNNLHLTKIIATHDLDFAKQICQTSLVLKNGEKFISGNINEVLNDDENLF
ncbi:MAG: ABC transporter ATP-binding protein [Treponema sp.]|nr:ABC transporter ATP-binding protein [Treponema sp.]